MLVSVKIVNPLLEELGGLPNYESEFSAGLDLRACISEPITLKAGTVELIGTGLAIHLNRHDTAAIILPRSGLGHKKGLILGNTIGLIDADYQGEIFVSCWNRSCENIIIEPGLRFAQLVILPILHIQWQLVTSFDAESQRGAGGFGSTGTA